MTNNHAHDSYEIYYMCSGERFYFIKDRTYHVRPGDLVLIEPNVLHRTTEAYSSNHERILINFKTEFAENFIQDRHGELTELFGSYPLLRLGSKEQMQIAAMLDKMLLEYKLDDEDSPQYIRIMLAELLLVTRRYARLTTVKQPEYPNTLHQRVSDIAKFINEHYHEPISLKLLADRFHMSQFYLSRIYKEVTGFTFVDYVNQVRIKESQKLLKSTKFNITAITEKVGFENSTHFGRVFKTITGVAPLQYRKLHKQ
ncbi:AraC family transcriptional regulator [Paenibacillus thalictri]|uniref:AraC family transcriptional regulator n=2 Tax=Paenibacillus thalictri TaxID=2527873 RepID=A0A4Q9DT16_9BACL|nr:AraC family transcriptional regulator [Paenibacillus thalictri]